MVAYDGTAYRSYVWATGRWWYNDEAGGRELCNTGTAVFRRVTQFRARETLAFAVYAAEEHTPTHWSPAVHRMYPADFRAVVLTLLQVWRRGRNFVSTLPLVVVELVIGALAPELPHDVTTEVDHNSYLIESSGTPPGASATTQPVEVQGLG